VRPSDACVGVAVASGVSDATGSGVATVSVGDALGTAGSVDGPDDAAPAGPRPSAEHDVSAITAPRTSAPAPAARTVRIELRSPTRPR
jgi:hypothetical protein